MSSLNTHGGAWSNRQGMWPLSEKRIVFTSKKDYVSEKWIENFRKVVRRINGIEDNNENGSSNTLIFSNIEGSTSENDG